jgi:hypothetical protein
MFASVKALLFGEDMSSDPVSKTLGLVLRVFSGGAVTIDVHTFSQYLTLIFIGFISISSLRCADLLLLCVACALAIPWAGMLCIEPHVPSGAGLGKETAWSVWSCVLM